MPKNELSGKANTFLVRSSGSVSKFLPEWIENNKDTFNECMERVADELPQKYCELYLKMIQIASQQQPAPKQTNIDTMNVNVSSKLDALGDIHDTSWRKDSNFTNYEEIKDDKQ